MAVCRTAPRLRLQRLTSMVCVTAFFGVHFITSLWLPRDAARAAFVPGRHEQAGAVQQHRRAVGKQHIPARVATRSEVSSRGSSFSVTWPVASFVASIIILAVAQPVSAGRDPPRTEPLGDEWKALIAPDIAVIVGAVAFNLYQKGSDGKK
mmetsp:Transcript_54150/g.108775  ORF Transcript_54150/g.108775 Transcript_54150/m.108775 type:complete len:151 (-) Transcript_54150:110-562(-)